MDYSIIVKIIISDNYQALIEKVNKQRLNIKKQEQLSQKLILEKLEKRQAFLENKRNNQKVLIESYVKKLKWKSTPPHRQTPKVKGKKVLDRTIESESPEESKGEIFGLTEIMTKPKLKKIIELIPPKQITKKLSNTDFIDLSPTYIIERINEAQRKHEKISFKGVGIESTLYYKNYMLTSKESKKNLNKSLPEKYINLLKIPKRSNEHIQSFNRVKQLIQKSAEKKKVNYAVVLESNLDNAYKKMDQDLNRVAAYAKYSLDFP